MSGLERRGLLAALVVAGLAFTWHVAEVQPWTVDDAFITFRYARNVLEGAGPVYNPGEWVDGYTSAVWLALLVLGGAVGVAVPTVAKGLGLLSALGALGMMALFPGLSTRERATAVMLLGTSHLLSAWAMAGLEAPLAAALVLSMIGAYRLERPRWVGGLGAVAVLTRPELILTVLVLGVGRHQRTIAGWFAALLVPVWALRWSVYGWPLPNAFYAKVGATVAQLARGVDYVGGAAYALAGVLVGVVAWGFLHRRLPVAERWWGGRLAAVITAQGLGIVAVGGDALPAFRFVVPVLGPLVLLSAMGIAAVGRRWWALAAVALALQAWGNRQPALTSRIANGRIGANGLEVGRFLRAHLPADTLIATNTAGSVPWASRLPTIDMLGLNDAHIAHRTMRRMGQGAAGHEKADGRYVLSRQPGIIIFGAARGRERPVFTSDRQLARLPAFRSGYVFERYRLPSGSLLSLYRRRDLTPETLPPPLGPPR